MKPVWQLTPQEAAGELQQHLAATPDKPWESPATLAWRERKAMLELWLFLHPVPNQANSRHESPISLPVPRSRQKPRRLRPMRRCGVIA